MAPSLASGHRFFCHYEASTRISAARTRMHLHARVNLYYNVAMVYTCGSLFITDAWRFCLYVEDDENRHRDDDNDDSGAAFFRIFYREYIRDLLALDSQSAFHLIPSVSFPFHFSGLSGGPRHTCSAFMDAWQCSSLLLTRNSASSAQENRRRDDDLRVMLHECLCLSLSSFVFVFFFLNDRCCRRIPR